MDHPTATPAALAMPDRVVPLRGRTMPMAPVSITPPGLGAPLWHALLGSPAPTAAECELLNALAQTRNVANGGQVFGREETARTLVGLVDGDVALGFRTADGIFRNERIVRGPAWLDLSSAWLSGQHAMDALAWSPITVVEIPRDALATQLERHPALARRIIQCLAREVQALAVNTHELMHKDAPARLAQWLHEHCERDGQPPQQAVVQLPMRKRDIASQLAITPETLSRLMRSFTRQGVIEVAGYTVRVLNVPALAALAQG